MGSATRTAWNCGSGTACLPLPDRLRATSSRAVRTVTGIVPATILVSAARQERQAGSYSTTAIPPGSAWTVYLDGKPEPEIAGEVGISLPAGCGDVWVGGRCDHFADFEGKIDEVAVYDRALSAREAAEHYRAAGTGPPHV